MQVIEGDFAVGDVESGIELLNGLPVSGGVGEMDLSLAVKVGEGAGGLYEKIGFAGDGIVVSGESLDGGEVSIVEVGTEGESAVSGEMAVLEGGGGVEFGGSVLAAQNSVAKSDGTKRKLD